MAGKRFAFVERDSRYVWYSSPDGEEYFLTNSEYRELGRPEALELGHVRVFDTLNGFAAVSRN